MINKLISFLLITIVYLNWSCSNDSYSNKEIANNNLNLKDTIVTFRIQGTPLILTMNKPVTIDIVRFQQFLNDYANSPFYNDTSFVDLTGDGKTETLIKTIKCTGSSCELNILVKNENEILYTDTLKSDDDFFLMEYWNNDSSYFGLKPWSTFYHMMTYTNVLMKEEQPIINKDLKEFYLNMRSNELFEKTNDSIKVKKRARTNWKAIRFIQWPINDVVK
jgi:hypothetical protein